MAEFDAGGKHVLLLAEYGILNGGERSFLAVADMLILRGWKFTAAVPRDTEFETSLSKLGISNVGFVSHDEHGVRFQQDDLRGQIRDLVDQVKPDLLHANSLSMTRLCGPVVGAGQTLGLGYLRDILKLSKKAIADINQMSRVIAVSAATRQWHVDQGMTADLVRTIHNGVDSQEFCPAPLDPTAGDWIDRLRSEFGIGAGEKVILYVGQIGMRKGINALIDCFLRVADQVSDVHLLIVGQRNSVKAEAVEYELSLREQVGRSGFEKRVHWLGRRTDVNRLMQMADMLLHPARQEPLGRVLLEASASGLPIVTTEVGGSPEILIGKLSRENLLPLDQGDRMVEQVLVLLRAPELRDKVAAEVRRVAIERFSVERCADSLEQAYGQLLAGEV
jgi:glycosyltransferase involved in cell wall biosynthesis